MTGQGVARHKTALTRAALSRPMATAMADGLLSPGRDGLRLWLRQRRRHPSPAGSRLRGRRLGSDPPPGPERRPADIVNLGLRRQCDRATSERLEVLRSAWELAEELLVVSARMTWDARDLAGRPMGDGLVTRTGTFQKFYEQTELSDWIAQTLGREATCRCAWHLLCLPRRGGRPAFRCLAGLHLPAHGSRSIRRRSTRRSRRRWPRCWSSCRATPDRRRWVRFPPMNSRPSRRPWAASAGRSA